MQPCARTLLALAAAGCLMLTLAGCASDDESMTGSPFSQALYQNYTDLAAQVQAAPAPETDESFWDNPFGLFGSDNPNDALAQVFTDKAAQAAQGAEPAPEPAPADPQGQSLRARLVQAIAQGKSQFPEQAARAQTDYDCWVVDSASTTLAATAQACRTALNGSLAALETAERPAPAPAPAPAPVTTAPPALAAAPAPTDYTVYFDFDSWTLTAEDLTVLTNAIKAARAGGESHITVVGHTDTSGPAAYNQRLSVRRANVVVEALVDMGARRDAIKASGVGEHDLAVQTPDGVRNAKNRRAVIGLLP